MYFFSNFVHQNAHKQTDASIADRKALVVGMRIAAGLLLAALAPSAWAATVSQSVVVEGTPAQVWTLVGPFCAIKDWLPPVGTCSEDGGAPPIRTLVTKDGSATFVEQQTERSETAHFYSYTFLSSPLPVTHYASTISVAAVGDHQSIVTWRGTYTPDSGMEENAASALDGIYAAGLESIRDLAGQRFQGDISSRKNP